MVQNADEGKEDIGGVRNAEKGCFHTELLIVGNSKKLLTSRTTALSRTKLHYSFPCSVTDTLVYTCTPGISRNLSKELNTGFINSNIT